jgi:hypothetical protein
MKWGTTEVTLITIFYVVDNLFSFTLQGPDSSSNNSSCNNSTPSSPALVMTTQTPHSITKQQFHFPGKNCSFLLAQNVLAFTEYDVMICLSSSAIFFLCLYANIWQESTAEKEARGTESYVHLL